MKGQVIYKKRALNKDGASVSKEKLEIGSSSQIIKPTFYIRPALYCNFISIG